MTCPISATSASGPARQGKAGAQCAFGNSDKYYMAKILGTPLGEGKLPADGDYLTALAHGHTVVPLIHEVFGGLASRACATIKFGARRAGDKKRGRDGTKYSRFHRRNYLSHHLAAIVSAVVLTDASNIEDGITALKQRVTGLAPAGSA